MGEAKKNQNTRQNEKAKKNKLMACLADIIHQKGTLLSGRYKKNQLLRTSCFMFHGIWCIGIAILEDERRRCLLVLLSKVGLSSWTGDTVFV